MAPPRPRDRHAQEGPDRMTAQAPVLRTHGNAYNIFILVLTIFSLAFMVLLLLPLSPAERELLTVYDNAVCVDLPDRLRVQPGRLAGPKRAYFIGQRGWLDLHRSPTSAWFQLGATPAPGAAWPGSREWQALLGGNNGKDAREGRAGTTAGSTRRVHHDPARGDRALGGEHPRPGVRESVARRQHPDGRRCASGGAS